MILSPLLFPTYQHTSSELMSVSCLRLPSSSSNWYSSSTRSTCFSSRSRSVALQTFSTACSADHCCKWEFIIPKEKKLKKKGKEAKVFFVLRRPSRWTCPTWWSRPSTPTPSPFRWPLNPRWHCHCSQSPVSQVSLEVSQEAGKVGMGHTSLLTIQNSDY